MSLLVNRLSEALAQMKQRAGRAEAQIQRVRELHHPIPGFNGSQWCGAHCEATDKWGGPHGWGSGDCSSPAVDDSTKVMVLAEECGEVARAVLDLDADATRTELVQVAAVAVAWLEAL